MNNMKQIKKTTTQYFRKTNIDPSTISFAYLAHIVGHNTQYHMTACRAEITVI